MTSLYDLRFRTTNQEASFSTMTTATTRIDWCKVLLVLFGSTAFVWIQSSAFPVSSHRNERSCMSSGTCFRSLDEMRLPIWTPQTSTRASTERQQTTQSTVRSSQRAMSRTALRATRDFSPSSPKKGSIFTDYDGPIVLVGRSASKTTSELGRLSQSLHDELGYAVQDVTPSSRILQGLLEEDDGSASSLASWNGVIVLDLAGFDTDQALRGKYRQAASMLYQSNALCVYVNVVEPVNGLVDEEGWDAFFESATDYELVVKSPVEDEGSSDPATTAGACTWSHLQWELVRLLGRAQLPSAAPGSESPSVNTAHLTMGMNTFFLSLSFPAIEQVQPYVESMCQDVDAMEYRVDLLSCRDSRVELINGMQLLRQYCRPYAARVPSLSVSGAATASSASSSTPGSSGQVLEDVMPIVYTVRTKNQAGTYPDDEAGISNMFTLLEWGLRAGVEVLDVESAWNPDATDALLDKTEKRYSSQILGSHHIVGREVTTEDAVLLFEQCELSGRAHGAKVVLSVESDEKDRMAYEAALISSELARAEGRPVIPHVSLVLGEVGQFSRVINLPFTPVTHESLPFKAAPGQMTSNEIMATRLLTKIFEPKKYAILGHNIAYSVSPQMHGAAFAATKLPHEYVRVDVATVEEFVESPLFQSEDFGGTSVTIPHKQAIIPYVDVLSQEASEIGSVNTLIVKQEFDGDGFRRVVYGDNTDWRGEFFRFPVFESSRTL
jgi:3-dehydroquinate dehydratase type I